MRDCRGRARADGERAAVDGGAGGRQPDATLKLPRRRLDRHRQSETELVHSIIRALHARDGVQVWRQNTGRLRDMNGRAVSFGLCVGSSDIIGIVLTESVSLLTRDAPVLRDSVVNARIGRFFALEVKKHGERPTDVQEKFLEVVRKVGGFASWVTSIAEALAALDRARDPRVDR